MAAGMVSAPEASQPEIVTVSPAILDFIGITGASFAGLTSATDSWGPHPPRSRDRDYLPKQDRSHHENNACSLTVRPLQKWIAPWATTHPPSPCRNQGAGQAGKPAKVQEAVGYFFFSSMLLRMSAAISSFAKSKTVAPSPVFASALAPSEISSSTISECSS